jgi:hypothetical protein
VIRDARVHVSLERGTLQSKNPRLRAKAAPAAAFAVAFVVILPAEFALGETPAPNTASPHWAFQPVEEGSPPSVHETDRLSTGIDPYVIAALAQRGLSLAPPADARTLIRRVTFDLTGLPPSAEEVAAFVADDRPDAYERLVERLLASPRYGERQGRHWLDVARYADTRGYVFQSERKYPYSYTYRDWVIRAFSEDLPYDRFLIAQIAADRLEASGEADRSSLAAMGFLTLGRRFLNNQHDIIDDRIDVVTRGMLGLTVQCARCHDHKYDPVPTTDYYSLYSVFANSAEPDDLPIIAEPEASKEYDEFRKELDRRRSEHESFVAAKHAELLAELRGDVARYLLATIERPVDPAVGVSVGAGDVKPSIVARWREFLEKDGGPEHPIFAAWHALRGLPAEGFSAEAERWTRSALETDTKLHRALLEALLARVPQNPESLAAIYGELFRAVDAEWTSRAAGVDSLSDPSRDAIRKFLYDDGSPIVIGREQVERFFDRPTRTRSRELRSAIERFEAESPGAPARGMVLVDRQRISDHKVLVRGNPGRPGPTVERRFLKALSSGEPARFTDGSGRLELARAIASPENPLTARVFVNRVWIHHFGRGLVRTPSDFGTRSEPPTHPELLDYLAASFVRSGWSIKVLQRSIVLSSTYRQSAVQPAEAVALAADPENDLLWRFPARRLELEALRDALLATAAELDLEMEGPSVEIFEGAPSRRRTVYGFVERQNLPSIFRVFDFASPDATCPQRFETTVPQQALYLMNHPFVAQVSRAFVTRPEFSRLASSSERIRFAYATIFGRDPEPAELELALEYTSTAGSDDAEADRTTWQRYIQALFLTNEFVFID